MARQNSVKIQELYSVAPAPGSPDSTIPKTLPLTFFDLLWLRFSPAQNLFFYEISSPNTSFFDSILPKLKQSLSLTLQYYLPLAGNLIWPEDSHKPTIVYVDGDAVSLTVAESDADFHRLSGTDLREATECHSLIPHLAVSHQKAKMMALQVTLFPNAGFCVGISMHHAVLDGKATALFMNSWSQICKNLEEKSWSLSSALIPVYDRMVIKDPAGLQATFLKQWMDQNGPNNESLMTWKPNIFFNRIRGTFELTREKLERLRHWIALKIETKQNELNINHPTIHLSTFSVTCAYAWVCLVKAERIKDEKSLLVFNVDCRTRLEPPIPNAYFGNCVTNHEAWAETEGLLGEDGLVVAAEAISGAIRRLEIDGVLSGLENRISKMCGIQSAPERRKRVIGVAGSPRFELYGTDFGWGRPRKVELTSIDGTGAIWLSDSKNGDGGVGIGLVLEKPHMDDFASLFSKGLQDL
ncbi:hypothetical protein FNV43_RR14566 [Rhamnella rubrinervis]|uniref:Uncharacterized protein n=1 Tax=Rhamnella rubrinervis TaxID=2594499 RepID=A0A8K0H3B7_9ROSA|nr:hypothetical protein FNV43_RR14566 [Rhamnella rubrinervis]